MSRVVFTKATRQLGVDLIIQFNQLQIIHVLNLQILIVHNYNYAILLI